jgi:hypothetical protein
MRNLTRSLSALLVAVGACAASASVVLVPAQPAGAQQLFETTALLGGTITYNCFPYPRDINDPLSYYDGLTWADNQCDYRVWLHEYTNYQNNNGWAFCISPGQIVSVEPWYWYPQNIYVSNNPAQC